MRGLILALAIGIAVCGASAPQQRQLGEGRKRVALVIGNDAYTSLPVLSNAVSDARAMSAALGKSGFQVTLVENAGRERLETEVQKFLDKLDRGDVALFYYSGHGLQLRGENYLAPVDLAARDGVQARTRSVNALEVLERMELAGADLQIVILDACRNNPYGGRGEGQGLAPMKSTGKGTFIAYATAPGRTASDGVGKNGLYTEQLLGALQKPGLTLEEVFKQAAEAVMKASGGNQIPWTSSSVSGNFYFNGTFNLQMPAPVAGPAAPAKQDPLPAPTLELRYGSLAVSSDQGGTLSVDGTAFGELQPFAVMNFPKLPAGPHWVRVEKPGFQPAEQQVMVMPDQRAAADLKLVSLGTVPSLPTQQIPGGAVQTRLNPKDGQRYVWIPPGTFQMGCSPGDSECSRESPAHAVTVSRGFWLGQTEVTVAAFQAFSRSAGSVVPSGQKAEGHPLVNVTWDEAASYCRWIGGRLPTEAEWEYAARGGVNEPRYGVLDAVAWHGRNSGVSTHEVAKKQPNVYGLYDMLGNVWEWVTDWYDDATYYKNSPASDPSGPLSGSFRVLRGGSWYDVPSGARASSRYRDQPSNRYNSYGFRCAWE